MVAVHAGQGEARRGAKIVFPYVHRLFRKTINKIDYHGGVVVGAELFHALQDGIAPVHALHVLTHFAVEGLHPEGEAVDAPFQRRFHLFVFKVMDTAFKRNFAGVRERQVGFYRGKDAL